MQRTVPQDTSQSAFTAPFASGLDRHLARDIVFVVIHVKPQWAANVVFHELAQPALAVERALGAAKDVVAVRQEPRGVGRGVSGNVQDVPDVCRDREGRPLQGEADGGGVVGDGGVKLARSLAFCAPEAQGEGAACAVADFLCEEAGVWVVLLQGPLVFLDFTKSSGREEGGQNPTPCRQ